MQRQDSALLHPVSESENKIAPSGSAISQPISETDAIVPVNCILSYGTFLISQSHCDELTDVDNSGESRTDTISCELPEGTLLLTQRECEILKSSEGSRDVMKSLD